MDAAIPLALLPVRLEARFDLDAPAALLLRVYPDVLHADTHRPQLTETELELGREFWRAWWQADGDSTLEDAAFDWLAESVGPFRAAWVAKRLTPKNLGASAQDPVFPGVKPTREQTPALARLLPDRWGVRLYHNGELLGPPIWGNSIPRELAVAPALTDLPAGAGIRDLLRKQGLLWTVDFREATAVGMGIRIELDQFPSHVQEDGFSEVVVFGVRASGDASKEWAGLLESHRFSHGLDVLAPGTPTNNTDTVRAGFASSAWTADTLLRPELAARRPRPRLSRTRELYRADAADALVRAFGLRGRTALDLAEHADDRSQEHSRAMNTALWPTTLGKYVGTLLGDTVSDQGAEWLRSWFLDFVRGAGPLPSLRVGRQPYGVLPIVEGGAAFGGRKAKLESVLTSMSNTWRKSLANVAHLDPDAADAPGHQSGAADPSRGEAVAAVAKVLGAVPNPWPARLGWVESKRELYEAQYGFRKFLLWMGSLASPDQDGEVYAADQLHRNETYQLYEQLERDLAQAGSIADQIEAYETLAGTYQATGFGGLASLAHRASRTSTQRTADQALLDLVNGPILELLRAHEERIEPFLEHAPRGVVGEQMTEDRDPELFYVIYDEKPPEPWRAGLVVDGGTGSAEDVSAMLAALRDEIDAGTAGDGFEAHRPLLQQLLRHSATVATDTAEVREAIETLRLAIESGEIADPVKGLERLMRETLGLAAYRLDAWQTSLAAHELAIRRRKKPVGLHIGGYGWLTRLEPASSRVSQGFVHAPSLDHAATAAVLRSGWSAYGDGGAHGTLAVDLRSSRIRTASWILDGLRAGRDLAEIAGARFERALHDAGLDEYLDDVRDAVSDASGEPRGHGIVNGLLLGRAFSGASDLSLREKQVRKALVTLLGTIDDASRKRAMTRALRSLSTDLDAVGDALTAQAVHEIVRGNPRQAGTSLQAIGSGDAPVPELSFANTRRGGQNVTHRLVQFLPSTTAGSWPASATSGRALASPAVESLAVSLLPAPERVVCTAHFLDPGDGTPRADPVPVHLSELGLGALDAVFAVPPSLVLAGSALEAAVANRAREQAPADLPADTRVVGRFGRTEWMPATAVSFDEFAVVAERIRAFLGAARPMEPKDLTLPENASTAAEKDIAALQARAAGARSALDDAITALEQAIEASDQDAVVAGMTRLWSYGIPGTLSPSPSSLSDRAAAVVEKARTRAAAYDQALAEATASGSGEVSPKSLVDALTILIGGRVPIVSDFMPSNPKDLAESFAKDDGRLGTSGAYDWLRKVSRVRDGARIAFETVQAAEAVAGGPVLGFRLAQFPEGDDAWAAVSRPAQGRGRLCILGLATDADGGLPDMSAPMSGLVIDGWTETIPDTTQVTGIGVHFDAPGARPPNAILLAVADQASGFTAEGVAEMVKETLDRTRMRAVGPQELDGLGHFLPAIYLPDDLAAGEEEEE